MSKRHDITVEQGATFTLQVEWKDADGDPINLTGYTSAMQIRRTYGAPALLTLASGGAISIDAAAGKLTVTIPAATTAALAAPMQGVYDLEVTTGTTVYRLLEGSVLVTPEVTR